MPPSASDSGSNLEDLEQLPFDLDIDPYKFLAVEHTAVKNEIRKAYYRAAQMHHPDKVKEEEKDDATKRFQQIQFAYSILSDPVRRKRYDDTGSTTEATTLDEDDFNWKDFYDSLMKFDENDINELEKKYKGSDEEKEDVLAAYTKFEGEMDQIYENVILSNVLIDDQRFRKIINDAIDREQVIKFRCFTHESDLKSNSRVKRARKERKEAEEYAKELKLPANFFGGKDEKAGDKKARKQQKDDDVLKMLIQQRNQDRQQHFFDQMEAKWGKPMAEREPKKMGAKKTKDKKGTKRPIDEPPEEAFEKNKKKAKTED